MLAIEEVKAGSKGSMVNKSKTTKKGANPKKENFNIDNSK